MTITLRKAVAGLAAAGALSLAGAAPALAAGNAPVPSGPGTAICGPSNGSFHAAGGPGYAQYQSPPVSPVAGDMLCTVP